MRICLISGSWPPAVCGVSDAMWLFGKRLTDDPKTELSVITTKGYNGYSGKRKNLKIFDLVSDWGFGNLQTILKKVKEVVPDIVHIQYPTKEYGKKLLVNLLPFFLKLNGFKVIVTIHEYSHNLSWMGRVRLWPSIFWADRVLVSDPLYAGRIRRVFFWKKVDPIAIAPNIPPSNLNDNEKIKLRKKLAGDEKTVLLGFFGFLNRNKIVLPVLRVLKKLREDFGIPVKFVMIGEIDWNSPEGRGFKEEMDKLGVRGQCVITGRLSDCEVADYLSVLDYAVLLYSSGLSPRNATFLAAMDQKIKIITTFQGEKRPSYPNVFFADIDPVEALVQELCVLIKENLNKKVPYPKVSYFEKGWKEYTESHIAFYRKIIGGRKP